MSITPDESTIPNVEETRRTLWTVRDLVVGLTVLLTLRLVIFVSPESLKALPFWMQVGIPMFAQFFLLAYPLLLARGRSDGTKFRWPGAKKVLVEAAVTMPVVGAIVMLLLSIGCALHFLLPRTSLTPDFWRRAVESPDVSFLIVTLIASFTIAPICEEVFFRSFLHSGLRTRMPVAVAAVCQSLIFAILHTFGAVNAVFVFFLGLLLTAVYEWRKTLLAPIFVHAGNNLFAAAGIALMMIVQAISPVLGVSGHDVPQGCQVDLVHANTAAAMGRIAVGDIITEFDGQQVTGFEHLAGLVRQHRAGDWVRVNFVRKGTPVEIRVILEKRP